MVAAHSVRTASPRDTESEPRYVAWLA